MEQRLCWYLNERRRRQQSVAPERASQGTILGKRERTNGKGQRGEGDLKLVTQLLTVTSRRKKPGRCCQQNSQK